MLSSPDETAIPRVGFSLAMPRIRPSISQVEPLTRQAAHSHDPKQPLLDEIVEREAEENNRQRAQRDRFELGYWL